MASTVPVDARPLRLLSLDGGGIRGLSELVILGEMMHRIAWDEGLDEPPRPCQWFDLIGGTSTGGIIAVMLGRLGMTIPECMAVYSKFAKKVFGSASPNFKDGRFNAEILKEAIEEILEEQRQLYIQAHPEPTPEEQKYIDDWHLMLPKVQPSMNCKVFVCAMPRTNIGIPRLFRTYRSRGQAADVTIWQALRATSAAPTFFEPINIGEEDFIDGGLGCNNPVKEVVNEASRLWKGQRTIGCIVSVGTGKPGVIGLRKPDRFQQLLPVNLIKVMQRIATDCEANHQDMRRNPFLEHKYFRFNVEQGMQGMSLDEWQRMGEVKTHTEQYLRDAATDQRMEAAVETVRTASKTYPLPVLKEEAAANAPLMAYR